jgi:predicted Zn-dependent peptidase
MPDTWVHILADDLVWPHHPLGQNIAGSHESLAGITRDTILPFFHQSYHPRNMLVAVAGAFEPKTVVAQITNLLGDMTDAPIPTYTPAPPVQTQPRVKFERRPIEQGHLCLLMPAISRHDPERYALNVLNTVLGDGMSSRLFLSIREDNGLAYAIDSGLNLLQDAGIFSIYAGIDPDKGVRALQAVLDELERLRQEPVPAQELRKAKEFLKGRLVLSLENSYSQAAWFAYQALFQDDIKTPEEVLAEYEAITAAEVQAVAQKVIDPRKYNLVGVGDFAQQKALSRLILG